MAAATRQDRFPGSGPGCVQEVPTGIEDHRVLAGGRRRVGRGLLAIVLVLAPGWLIVNGLVVLVAPTEEIPWSPAELLAMFLVVLVLTPLQATGGGVRLRGLVFRVVGGWARGRRAGLVAGVLVSSVLFTAVHGSTDLYINVWYLVLGAGLAVIT